MTAVMTAANMLLDPHPGPQYPEVLSMERGLIALRGSRRSHGAIAMDTVAMELAGTMDTDTIMTEDVVGIDTMIATATDIVIGIGIAIQGTTGTITETIMGTDVPTAVIIKGQIPGTITGTITGTTTGMVTAATLAVNH